MAQGISTSYYPQADRTIGALAVKFGWAMGRDTLTNVFLRILARYSDRRAPPQSVKHRSSSDLSADRHIFLVGSSRPGSAPDVPQPRHGQSPCSHKQTPNAELVFPAKYRLIDVGPELLYHVKDAVQADLGSPSLVRFYPRVGLCRVIRIADARGRSGPNNLR